MNQFVDVVVDHQLWFDRLPTIIGEDARRFVECRVVERGWMESEEMSEEKKRREGRTRSVCCSMVCSEANTCLGLLANGFRTTFSKHTVRRKNCKISDVSVTWDSADTCLLTCRVESRIQLRMLRRDSLSPLSRERVRVSGARWTVSTLFFTFALSKKERKRDRDTYRTSGWNLVFSLQSPGTKCRYQLTS